MQISLRKTTLEDLGTLFVFQADEEANYIAAFNVEDPNDKDAYMNKWSKIITNPSVNMQTIIVDNDILGSVIHFDIMDETNVSYWIDKKHWGKGIASASLKAFLDTTDKKVLYARVAYDNIGSQKVLENNSFNRIGEEVGYAYGRQKEITEYVYQISL